MSASYLPRTMTPFKHLRRLNRVWIRDALFFITICVNDRRPILNCVEAAGILRREWDAAQTRHGWLIGRYVIMPDHVHFFCAEQPGGALCNLSVFVARWKEWTAKSLYQEVGAQRPIWQKQFFDQVLRSDESYAEKWTYVRDNPVRAGLVVQWEDWPYHGSVDFDHRSSPGHNMIQ